MKSQQNLNGQIREDVTHSSKKIFTIHRILSLVMVALILGTIYSPANVSAEQALPQVENQSVSLQNTGDSPISDNKGEVVPALENSPIMFIENVGQFDPRSRFVVSAGSATIYFSDKDIWFVVLEADKQDHKADPYEKYENRISSEPSIKGINIKLNFIGQDQNAVIEPVGQIETNLSYFLGSDDNSQYTGVPAWSGIKYKNIYPGMDLEISAQAEGLSWNFVITDSPLFYESNTQIIQHGIRIKLAGHQKLESKNEKFSATTPYGNISLENLYLNGEAISPAVDNQGDLIIPVTMQKNGMGALASLVRVQTENNILIQPHAQSSSNLLLAMLFGGGGYTYDAGWGTAVGLDGSVFVTGETRSPDFYPEMTGDVVYNGNRDGFAIKIGPGGNVEYVTYIGGSGSEGGFAIQVNNLGEAYIAGITGSTNFPLSIDAISASPTASYLLKLSAGGDQLLYSSYIGNSATFLISMDIDSDENIYMLSRASTQGTVYKLHPGNSSYDYTYSLGRGRWVSIAVDSSGHAYFTGRTLTSPHDVLAASISDTGSPVYSLSFGGGSFDSGVGVAVDSGGFVYITGGTDSANFPVVGTPITPDGVVQDVFVTILDPAGAIQYSSYLELTGSEYGQAIAVDSQGSIYVIGVDTESVDFPSTSGAVWGWEGTGGSSTDVFVVKLTPTVLRESYQVSYATQVGGTDWDYTYSTIGTVDNFGNVYITGETQSPDFVGTGGTVPDDYQAFVVKIATGSPSVDRAPLIFLPGLTGSRIYAPRSFTWSQPTGHGGNNYEHIYNVDDNISDAKGEIWINKFWVEIPGPDDFFDILRLEKDGVTQSTNALYGVDLEARDIVGKEVFDVYNEFLADLQSAGYQSGVDLFTFPYDWRMDIAHLAQLLDDKVLEALEIANGTEDQSQWKITQVDLVAHSMGASVAREYISYPAQAAHVRRLIAVGPVFLGAPKPLKGILFGDTLDIPGLNADEIKDIVQNMPGVFQVSPGNAYWEFYDGSSGNPVAFQEDYDFDGDNQELGDLSYDQFKSMLFGLNRDPNLNWDVYGKDINQTVFNMAEAFHSRLDFSWDSGIPIPEVDLIVGTGLCSIGQYQSTWRIKVGPVRIDPIVHVNEVNGDGTVPLFSASLYDPDRGIDHRGGANVYYVVKKYANHAFMLSKEPISQLVLNLLTGNSNLPDGIIQEAGVPRKCWGATINIESPVELHVTDAAGNHTGWVISSDIDSPMIEEGIPDSQYEEIEETKSVYLPDDGEYTIFLKATDSGSFNLILHLNQSDGTEKTIVYLRAPLTITTTGEMLFDTSSIEPPLLNLDHNGDGVTDDIIKATSVLDSTESFDSKPPQIEIVSPKQGQVLAGSALVEWQSNDDISGVLNEWGYIDMGTPNERLVSNGEVAILPYGEHTLTVLAEDRLGNASQEQVSFTVYSFEWLSPISGSGTYSAKAGNTIPVKFRVRDLNGVFVHDESVELNLLDSSGNVVAGPFVFAHNPTQGVTTVDNKQYHHNLQTKGLAPGSYILKVFFNSPQINSIVELPIILQ